MFGRSMALPRLRWLLAALAVVGALVIAPAAQAVTPEKVLGNEVGCEILPANGNIRYCHGFVFNNWQEKTKIDVNVFMPPEAQGNGTGRALLAEAERVARDEWHARMMRMTVIDVRTELIAWYERRGYRRTGEYRPFPYGDARFGIPKRDDLRFEWLVKDL